MTTLMQCDQNRSPASHRFRVWLTGNETAKGSPHREERHARRQPQLDIRRSSQNAGAGRGRQTSRGGRPRPSCPRPRAGSRSQQHATSKQSQYLTPSRASPLRPSRPNQRARQIPRHQPFRSGYSAAMLACAVCAAGFYGRSDARYCSAACRQKAHRAREARRIAALVSRRGLITHPRPSVSRADLDTIRRRAHAARDRADELRARSACQLDRARQIQQRAVDRRAAEDFRGAAMVGRRNSTEYSTVGR